MHIAKPFNVLLLSIVVFCTVYFYPPAASPAAKRHGQSMHCKENPIYVFLFWELRGLSHNFHIHVSVSDLYIPRICPHISLQQNRADRSWKYINFSQIYEYRNWETAHYNCVLEITVSFLGIHKWEPDIYIGSSLALHLQCATLSFLVLLCQPWPTLPSPSALQVDSHPLSTLFCTG